MEPSSPSITPFLKQEERLLKTFCITLFKAAALALVVSASFLALTARYSDNHWDPIKEIQKLKDQHRRDDAIDLVNFLKDNRTYNAGELSKLKKEVAYSPFQRVKELVWDGAIKGQVNDTYSGIGAMAADFCVFGDIRDIGIQTYNLLFHQKNFNGVIGVLSGAGIAFSTLPMFDGLYAMSKDTAKYVSKLPVSMDKGLLKSFLSGQTSPKLSHAIYDLLKKTNGPFPERLRV